MFELGAEPAVHAGRRPAKMVGEIVLSPVEEIARRDLCGCSSRASVPRGEVVAQPEEQAAQPARQRFGFGGHRH